MPKTKDHAPAHTMTTPRFRKVPSTGPPGKVGTPCVLRRATVTRCGHSLRVPDCASPFPRHRSSSRSACLWDTKSTASKDMGLGPHCSPCEGDNPLRKSPPKALHCCIGLPGLLPHGRPSKWGTTPFLRSVPRAGINTPHEGDNPLLESSHRTGSCCTLTCSDRLTG